MQWMRQLRQGSMPAPEALIAAGIANAAQKCAAVHFHQCNCRWWCESTKAHVSKAICGRKPGRHRMARVVRG
jgi:hypothetical protein